MTEYQRQLKDPKWQKKRLEILDRDEWTCQTCENTEATLTVHHKSYKYQDGAFSDVWDYEGEDLITLCEKCHSEEEASLSELQKTLYFGIRNLMEDSAAMVDTVKMLEQIYIILGRRITIYDIDAIFSLLEFLDKTNKTELSMTGYICTKLIGGGNEH